MISSTTYTGEVSANELPQEAYLVMSYPDLVP